MDRLQKKCLVGSTLFHGFLLLLLVFGSAFFVAKEKPLTCRASTSCPPARSTRRWPAAAAIPNLPRTDDLQKGQTLAPQQPAAPPPPVEKPQPEPAQPKRASRLLPNRSKK